MAPVTIEISDDDDGDAQAPAAQAPTAKVLGKRRMDGGSSRLKDTWTDDSDDAPDRSKKPKLKGSTSKKGQAQKKGKSKPKGLTSRPDLEDQIKDLDESEVKSEVEDANLPDYLRKRRRDFDKDRALLKEAGLKLPPDYYDIYFSDDERLAKLERRPRFPSKSGIKPCRPYEDVTLEYSAGVIPAAIAQYLRDYQIAGVKFLHQKFVYQRGGILGDDMGLGKTVQVAAFLTAAFGKTGDERDAKRMRKMRRAGAPWYPRVLIVCPGSLIQNWKNELNRWGWWQIDSYHGSDKDDVLNAAKAGRLEIMITTYATFMMQKDQINTLAWDCVVADECHCLKDRRSGTTKAMNSVNALCRIGLTGTAIQNKYEELWTLLNWTNPGHFGSSQEWARSISKPLTVGQSHDATVSQLSLARATAKKLVQNLLPEFFLRRMKTLIAEQLPKKTDKVVFCPLTDIQAEAYQNYIAGPAVQLILRIGEPCDCGSKRKAGWCCYAKLPSENGEPGKAWTTLVFPAIMTLQKIANHLTLLIPNKIDPSEKQQSELNSLRLCLPNKWDELYRSRESILLLANPEFCGKWNILKKLLHFWHDHGDKVLVFSHSVRLLRILQHLFRNTSYSVSFLDGSLSYEERQQVVDDFNSDPSQFVFLISTKAGGVGLNITSANKVVIFDPHWNPAYDLQAQDRAYRIGQVRDVDVFRLVSAGTIEEIVYARQVYKQQQANIGYNASNERRYFRGVQQDSTRKGEIFGLQNLLSYRKNHILREIVNKTNVAEAKAGVHLAEVDLEQAVKEEDELKPIKQEDDDGGGGEDGGMRQLAQLITAETSAHELPDAKKAKPKSDAIAAILSSVGVEYTHENSEVIGSSKVEAQLSRRAEQAATASGALIDKRDHALFKDSEANLVHGRRGQGYHLTFNPPRDVMTRQFCTMAREFGFPNATDFALVVESWSQEQRRNCLDTFYKRREAAMLEKELRAAEDVKPIIKDKKPVVSDLKFDAGAVKKKEYKGEVRIKGEPSSWHEAATPVPLPVPEPEPVVRSEIKCEKAGPSQSPGVKKSPETSFSSASRGQLGSHEKKMPVTIFLSDSEDDEL